MIVCYTREYVYLHLHKCAGTSIETALSATLGPDDILLGSTPDGEALQKTFKREHGLYKHSPAAAVCTFIGEERWRRFFTFATVRHPVSRLFSLYRYALRLAADAPVSAEEAERIAQGDLPNRPPFRYAAVRAALAGDDFNAFVTAEDTWRDPGAAPQAAALSIGGDLAVDQVYRVEELETAWAEIESRLGVTAALPRLNTTGSGTAFEAARAALGSEARGILETRYAADFAGFGYAW